MDSGYAVAAWDQPIHTEQEARSLRPDGAFWGDCPIGPPSRGKTAIAEFRQIADDRTLRADD